MKPWKTLLAFLFLTKSYLVKASMTQNKYLTLPFLEDYDLMTASSAG